MAIFFPANFEVFGEINSKSGGNLSWTPADGGNKINYIVNIYNDQNNLVKTAKSSKNTLKLSKLTPGEYHVRISASAGDENAEAPEKSFNVVDTVAPKINNLKALVNGYDVMFTVGATDDSGSIAQYKLSYGNTVEDVFPDAQGNFLVSLDENYIGNQPFTLTAYDAAGNPASKTVKVKIVDATPPEFANFLITDSNVNSKNGGTLSWTPASDSSGSLSYELTIRNGDTVVKTLKSNTTTVKVPKLNAGDYTLEVTAVDKAKNRSAVQSADFTVADGVAPKINNLKASVNGYDVTFTVSATDDSGVIDRYELSGAVSGEVFPDENGNFLVQLGENYIGNQSFTLTAYDAAGNSASKAVKVTISDATPPVFDNFSGGANIDSTGTGTLSWSDASDNSGSISRYQVNIYDEYNNPVKTLTTKTNSVNVSQMTSGDYTFEVLAFDAKGNSTVSERTGFNVHVELPQGGGIVRVHSNGIPILTQSSPLYNYNLTGNTYAMFVSSAGQAVSTTIANAAYAAISSCGRMDSTQIAAGGVMYVQNGGTADSTAVNGGAAVVSSGATVQNTTINEGHLTVDGGSAEQNSVCAATGYLFVQNSGLATGNEIASGGHLVANSGGTAQNTVVDQGQIVCSDSGICVGADIRFGGQMFVSENGRASDVHFSSGALGFIESNGLMEQVEADAGATVHMSPQGVLNGATLHSGALLEMECGASALNVNLDPGAAGITVDIDCLTRLQGTSGGAAFDIANGNVSGLDWKGNVINISSGIDLYLVMYSGTEVRDTRLSAGHILASSGALVSGTELHYYAQLNVYHDAVASGTVLDSEAEIYAQGGVIYDTTVNADGYVWVANAGQAYHTEVNAGGRFDIGSAPREGVAITGGFASDTIVNSSGYFQVISSTSAAQVEVKNGGTVVIDTGRVTDIDLAGLAIVKYTGLASNTEIKDGGRLQLFRAGSATETVVNGGTIDITGSIDSGELNLEKDYDKFISSAMIYTSGGFLSGTVMNSGYINLLNGGIVQGTTVNGGDYNVQTGGSALDTTLSGGGFQVSSGGFASNAVLENGFTSILDGAEVSGLTVEKTAGLYIQPRVTITEMTVWDTPAINLNIAENTQMTGVVHGSAFSCQDGVLNDYTVLLNGNLTLHNGARATGLHCQDGYVGFLAGASGSSVDVSGGAGLGIDSGAEVIDLTLVDGAGASVSGSIDGLYISAAHATLNAGARLSHGTVDTAGILMAAAGAELSETTVHANGTVALTEGVIHRGHITLDENASFQANHARIDFTICGISPSDNDPLIINQRYLYSGNYTVSVTADQQAGDYLLATGCASQFDPMGGLSNPMGLYVDDQLVGNISLNEALDFNSKTYSLGYFDGSLSLLIVSSGTSPVAALNQSFGPELLSDPLDLTAAVSDELVTVWSPDAGKNYNLLS